MMSEMPPPSQRYPSLRMTLRPIRSIFTLRPQAHTQSPPPESAPGVLAGTRVAWGRVAVAALVASAAVGFAGWHLLPKKKPEARAPIVLVNGAPQIKQTQAGDVQRWGSASVTVKIDASIDALGPGARAAVQTAFGAWVGTGAKLPGLTFDTASGLEPKLEPDGVSAVIFAPIDIPGHKKDLAITISFADPNTGRIVESDVIINSKKPFALLDTVPPAAPGATEDDDGEESGEAQGCQGWYDLQNVVTHEAGHFFGLDEDIEDQTTSMFYKTGKCELKKRDLATPDMTVMSGLYEREMASGDGGESDTGGGCGGGTVAGAAKPASSTGVAAIALILTALGRRRRR